MLNDVMSSLGINRWRCLVVIGGSLLLAAVVCWGLARVDLSPSDVVETMVGGAKAVYQTVFPHELRRHIWLWKEQAAWRQSIWLAPYTILLIAGILILERLMPVKREQRTFSSGFFQDLIWFSAGDILRLTWVPIYVGWLHGLYVRHLSALTIQEIEVWPMVARLTFSIVVFDFLQWFHHWVRHKVTLFWYFHTIHHSQRQMNLFTDGRTHPVETIVSQAVIFLPMFMLQLNPYAVAWIALASSWYQRLYHANIRTNFGVLKSFLVTPQSHRIHHSIEAQHRDKNFGVLFTVWDRMLGTLYHSYDEYPETGVEDEEFPLEQGVRGVRLATNYVAQWFYPFRLALRGA